MPLAPRYSLLVETKEKKTKKGKKCEFTMKIDKACNRDGQIVMSRHSATNTEDILQPTQKEVGTRNIF